jgi:hypothetical protein
VIGGVHKPQRNSPERVLALAERRYEQNKREQRAERHHLAWVARTDLMRRTGLASLMVSPPLRRNRFIAVPRKPRLSTRGRRGPTWLTKRHTPSRIADMKEALA